MEVLEVAVPQSQRLHRMARKAKNAAVAERNAWSRRRDVVKGQVFYESFAGNGMLCNPEAIFRELLRSPDQAHLKHVWALSDLETYRGTVEEFAGDPRVTFVKYRSKAYFDALAESEYLVNNATFPPDFGKRPGQTYLNTWHGTPMKRMGYDVPGGGPATANIIRNFVAADYLLSASDFMTRQMYEVGYKLRGIYRGRIIQEGSPRIDRQSVDAAGRDDILRRLRSRGVDVDGDSRVILYAPTWKGDFYSPLNDTMQLLRRVRVLRESIGDDKVRILLKVHQQVYRFAIEQPELRDVLVPNDMPTNVMLAATDALVTDYSSIFIDFLPTGRPVFFFLPDEADYSETRGLYVPTDAWPGPVTSKLSELAAHLSDMVGRRDFEVADAYAGRYDEFRRRYCAREDGSAARRVVDVVFRGRTDSYDLRSVCDDGRKSVLIYLGGMLPNGITTSALNLLDNIDYDRFDVSVFYSSVRDEKRRRSEAAINENARLFPRIGWMSSSKMSKVTRDWTLKHGMDRLPAPQRAQQERLFRDEWVRCFGMSRFDHVVDFSGYSPFWTYILLQGEAKTHAIWLHNDLAADAEREVDGRKPHERNLKTVFSTYASHDRLVSVSPALSDVNRSKLADYASPERFVSAPNTINYKRILRLAQGRVASSRRGDDGPPPSLDLDPADLPGAIRALAQHHALGVIREEVDRQETIRNLVSEVSGVTTFVTAGRLSPEKNHERLIRAFDVVHRDHLDTRLVIMGEGPLRRDLEALVLKLGLVSAVQLAGQQPNPYAVMANADCFVLSSDYEGQPMVILEAMVLGLPVVTTDFASVRDAVRPGQGLVVKQSVPALAAGMEAFLRNEVPAPIFDAASYNEDAVRQFYDAVGMTG